MVNPGCTIRPAQRTDLDRVVELLLALQDQIESSNPHLWRLRVEARANLKVSLPPGWRRLVFAHWPPTTRLAGAYRRGGRKQVKGG